MPELVEVEAARRLCEKIVSQKVRSCWIKPEELKVITFPCPALARDIPTLQAFLTGAKLEKAERKGKQLALTFVSGEGQRAFLFVHLGMAGTIVVENERPLAYKSFSISAAEWPPSHMKIELTFQGTRWAFCDMRRFGKVFLSGTLDAFDELAPDGLLELPGEDAWIQSLAKQRLGLKALLLNQKRIVSGIGNWIADEVLYQACLHPDTLAADLSEDQSATLRAKLKYVLEEGCRRNGEGFPEDWLFSYRWGAGSKVTQKDCRGRTITHLTSGGRTSAVVLSIQKLIKAPPASGKTHPQGQAGGSRRSTAEKTTAEGADSAPGVKEVSDRKRKAPSSAQQAAKGQQSNKAASRGKASRADKTPVADAAAAKTALAAVRMAKKPEPMQGTRRSSRLRG